ncbi:ferrochelatase [candidate division KSB1 bacterium]
MERTAVILFNLGGPDSPEAIEPFLFNLFMDPEIIALPFGSVFRKPLARFISRKRAKKVRLKYNEIGGSSPINELTEKQRKALEESLRNAGHTADVYTVMRYWHPLISETADRVTQSSYDTIVLLPLFPQFSYSTTRSAFNEWSRVSAGITAHTRTIESYHNNKTYIEAVNRRIDESLKQFPDGETGNVTLLFSAHSIPVSMIKKGDPYQKQVEETVSAVMTKRGGDLPHRLSYQSRVGPVKWLEPATEDTLTELAADEVKNVLVVPVSFVSDHLETVHELNIEYRKIAVDAGIQNYIVMEGLNDSPMFIRALHEMIEENL